MARTFNPLAAYGVITPPYQGAIHQQDGGYFAPDGKLLWEDHPPTPKAKKISEVTTVDSATGETMTTQIEEEVEVVVPGDPKLILSGWLKGETKLAFGTVRKLTKDGYDVVLATKDEIIDYLVNTASLVPAELVKA